MGLRAAAALAAGACLIAGVPNERADAAEVVISINKSTQSMSVLVDGAEQYRWAVSTGLGGGPHDGSYRAGRMERKWFSRKYNWAPMPHSIFFDGNYAIHGTIHVKRLGQRASKGCVRLHPANAAVLFELVRANHGSTSIVVSNTAHVAARVPPAEVAPAAVEPAALRPTLGADQRAESSVAEAAAPSAADLALTSAVPPTAVAAPSASPTADDSDQD